MSVIQYYKRSVFGRIESIPTGEFCDAVKTLTRRKTLTAEDIAALVTLGHTIEQVPQPNDPLSPPSV